MKIIKINVDDNYNKKSFFPKTIVFWNKNFNKKYINFLKCIDNDLKESGNIVLNKLGILQNKNELIINFKMKKQISQKEGFNERPFHYKVEISYSYKHSIFNDFVFVGKGNNRDLLKFKYVFKADYFNEIDDFIEEYNKFINNFEHTEIVIEKDFIFAEYDLRGTVKNIELDGYDFSKKDIQYSKINKGYLSLLDFSDKTKQHNFFKISPEKTDIFYSLQLVMKMRLDTADNFLWCLSFQVVSQELYSTHKCIEKDSEYRNELQLSNGNLMKALCETGIYKGLDYSDMNENNWQDYISMIDLISY